MAKRIDDMIRQKVITLLYTKITKKEIAKQCNISVATVFNISREEKNNRNIRINNLENTINLIIKDNNNLKEENINLKNDIKLLKYEILNLQQQIEPIIKLAKPALNITNINKDTYQTEKKLLSISNNSTAKLRL